jgi:ankyrin repeat protein
LEHGVDTETTDKQGWTALHKASSHSQSNIILELLKKRANTEAVDPIKGWTPLFMAAYYPEVIAILLAHGARTEAMSKEGETILHSYASAGCIDGIYLLLSNGCNVEATDHRGQTALHYAAEKNYEEVLRLLLNQGLDPNARNKANEAPIHIATALGYSASVEMLLRSGAEIEAQNADDHTALHIAVTKSNIEMTELLLSLRANINAKGRDGNTALHIAASDNNTDMVTLLLEREAKSDAKNHKGSTALHIAVEENNPLLVSLLLDKGPMANILDNEGNSPIDLATKNANLDLAKLMFGDGSNVGNALRFKKNTGAAEYPDYEHISLASRRTVKMKLLPSVFELKYNNPPSSREILDEICIEFSKEPQSKIYLKTTVIITMQYIELPCISTQRYNQRPASGAYILSKKLSSCKHSPQVWKWFSFLEEFRTGFLS